MQIKMMDIETAEIVTARFQCKDPKGKLTTGRVEKTTVATPRGVSPPKFSFHFDPVDPATDMDDARNAITRVAIELFRLGASGKIPRIR